MSRVLKSDWRVHLWTIRYRKKAEENHFTPLELNESNAKTLFNRCLATESSTTIKGIHLFTEASGHENDSATIFFDKEKLKDNESTINYLFGQLEDTHKRTFKITHRSSSITYNGTVWTKDHAILLEFLHLGRASDIITPFFKGPKSAALKDIEPTLSPWDPNFDTWYIDYQAKMNRKPDNP